MDVSENSAISTDGAPMMFLFHLPLKSRMKRGRGGALVSIYPLLPRKEVWC